jgi:hypothetical protein
VLNEGYSLREARDHRLKDKMEEIMEGQQGIF